MIGRFGFYSKFKDSGVAWLESPVGKQAVCMRKKGLLFKVVGSDSQ